MKGKKALILLHISDERPFFYAVGRGALACVN